MVNSEQALSLSTSLAAITPVHSWDCRTTATHYLEMSWEDAVASDGDDDWENLRADTERMPAVTNTTWGSGSDSDEEDATAKELAVERAERTNKLCSWPRSTRKHFQKLKQMEAKDALSKLITTSMQLKTVF